MKENRIIMQNIDKIDSFRVKSSISAGSYIGLKKALKKQPQELIKLITEAGLRGRGGAGFPTGTKWKYTALEKEKTKYVICNADEGEPGTFKDRILLEKDPHLTIEGLILAGYAIGANRGYMYIRGEYFRPIEHTEVAIKQAYEQGFLGKNILGSGFDFDIDIQLGSGSYLCGDELTLIESLEGKRGYPRYKPPYPAQKGLFGKPTVVNNVETLANVPFIVRHGKEWYRSLGTKHCRGTKIFNISGDVEKPGCYEAEFGIPLRDLIYDIAGGMKHGKKLKAVLLGGAAGTFLPEEYLDIKMCYDYLKEYGFTLGSGAIIVLNEDRKIGDTVRNILRFFTHESCGKCTPCRVGTKQLLKLADKILSNNCQAEKYFKEMKELTEFMFKSSLCALGQSPILPVKSAWKHFRSEVF